MVGIAIISHGKLCEGIVDSVSMVAGEMEQMETVSLKPGMTPDDYRNQVEETIKRLDTGKGVLVLVDLMGGTPFNTIAMLSRDLDVAIVTGMNMPMLINVAMERTEESTLDELSALAEDAAVDSIKVLRRQKEIA